MAMGGAEENCVWRKQHKATCIVGQRWSHVHRTDHQPAMLYGSHATLGALVLLVVRTWGIGG